MRLYYCFIAASILLAYVLMASPLASQEAFKKLYFEEEISLEQAIRNTRSLVSQHTSNNLSVLEMFDKTVALWQAHYAQKNGKFDIHTLLKAIAFAAIKHEGQGRQDIAKTPHLIHFIGVAYSLWVEAGIRSVNVLTASILHDTLEDSDATEEEIKALFGPRVLYTVKELTNDTSLPSQENKDQQVAKAPLLSLDAQLIKLADRLYNIRDIRNPPPSWSNEKCHRHRVWSQKLLDALAGTNEALEKALKEELNIQAS